MTKVILASAILFCTLVGFVKVEYTGEGDHCVPYSDEKICRFDVMAITQNHFRDCNKDVFMSLCALTNAEYNSLQRTFMCWNVNYCSGCRECYIKCCESSTACSSNIDNLSFYLGWYDAFTMGGRFVVCDFAEDYLNDTIYSDACIKGKADSILTCIDELTQTVHDAYNETVTCDIMDVKIGCFMDTLVDCPSSKDVLQQYFRGVVSLSPCVGKIPSVGDKAWIILSSLTTMLSLVLIPMMATFA